MSHASTVFVITAFCALATYANDLKVAESTLPANGNFETGSENTPPDKWSFWKREAVDGTRAVIVKDAARGNVCRITSGSKLDWAFTAPAAKVNALETYELTIYAKNNLETPPEAMMQISAFNDGKTVIYGTVPMRDMTKEWQKFSGKITLPKDVSNVTLRLVGQKECDFCVDDFTAKKIQSLDRIEAETALQNSDAVQINKLSGRQWNVWSKDIDADKKWSGGTVIQGPAVNRDTAPGEDSEILKFALIVPAPGLYDVNARVVRTVGVSADGGKTWVKNTNGGLIATCEAKDKVIELQIAACYVNEGSPGSPYIDFFNVTPAKMQEKPIFKKVEGFAANPIKEKLDAGFTAFAVKGKLYCQWRLRDTDAPNPSFDLYSVLDGKETKLNTAPIVQTTDYLGELPANANMVILKQGSRVIGKTKILSGNSDLVPCKTFTLSDPKARIDKVGIGDVDGDGIYDYVVRHATGNVDPWYKFWYKSPDTFKLEAVTGDGKSLWVKDLGWSIERGIWYSPYIVYDFNGDGKAEVALKMGEDDPRDADGKVTGGNEYLLILNGETGEEIARAPWPSRAGYEDPQFGYNFASRNQIMVAYLDGKTPAVIALRGTYTLMKAEAWQLKDGKLENLWKYNSAPFGRSFHGQGAHTTRASDIDGDGRDEIILGSAVLDDDGSTLWSTGLGHPDYVYVADLNFDNPGLEIATILETANKKGGLTMVDAKTGKALWQLNEPTNHVHFGFGGDIDAMQPGFELGGTDSADHKADNKSFYFNAKGELLASGAKTPFYGDSPRFIYWDADLQREIFKGGTVCDFNGGELGRFDGKFVMSADVFGDWREEIITGDKGKLIIYQTDLPAMDRRTTLMQDHNYRTAIAAGSMGYYYDAQTYDALAAVSPNLSILIKNDETIVAVSAPRDFGISGKLQVFSPDMQEYEVELKALEVKSFTQKIGNTNQIEAKLVYNDGKKLVNRQTIKLPPRKSGIVKAEGIVAEAENFVSENGGNAKIRTDKAGVSGKSISHWDNAGHAMEWKVTLPEGGKYTLTFRYTAANEATRELKISGKSFGIVTFASTGGLGNSPSDWENVEMDVEMNAGEQTITLINDKGTMLNLDYLSFQKK